ncbi:MAG: AAA family ATPase [Polyangia bacterium]|jgi:hypothetical protein
MLLGASGPTGPTGPSAPISLQEQPTVGRMLGWRVDGVEMHVMLRILQNSWIVDVADLFSWQQMQRLSINPHGVYGGGPLPFLTALWSKAVMRRDDEQRVLEAVQVVEPDIESIAMLGAQVPRLYATLKGVSERVPIGNLGEGVARLLALVCLLVDAKRGILLVDEIDTGLHVRVMEKLWRQVFDVARKFDVQVFATTHSEDCLHGLARTLEQEPAYKEDAALHRIDKGREETVVNDGDGIIGALDAGIEVR